MSVYKYWRICHREGLMSEGRITTVNPSASDVLNVRLYLGKLISQIFPSWQCIVRTNTIIVDGSCGPPYKKWLVSSFFTAPFICSTDLTSSFFTGPEVKVCNKAWKRKGWKADSGGFKPVVLHCPKCCDHCISSGCGDPSHKIISLLLYNCTFAIVMIVM